MTPRLAGRVREFYGMLLGAFSERRAGALHWASSRGNSLTFREDPAFSAGSGWRPSQRRPSGAGSTPAKSTTRRSGERAALQSGALPQEPKDGAQQKEPLRLVWRCVAGAIVCCLLVSAAVDQRRLRASLWKEPSS